MNEIIEDIIEKLKYTNMVLKEVHDMSSCECKVKKLGILQEYRELYIQSIVKMISDENFTGDFKDV